MSKIRDARIAAGLSLREAATRAGLDVVRFGEIEREVRMPPQEHERTAIMGVLRLTAWPTEVVYPPSTPADRQAETERVIATVCATIAPTEQAQALRDLMVGADGEPQLDEDMLERAAEEAAEDAREATAGEGLVYLRKIADESLIDAYRKRDQHRRERKGCDCDWCNVASAHERLFFFVETAMAENAAVRIGPAEHARQAAITARVRETERNLRTAGAEALRKQVAEHLEAQAAREEGESALAAHVLRTAAATVRGMVVGEAADEKGGSDA